MYLINVQEEINQFYNLLINKNISIEEFCENSTAIMYYYLTPIFNIGKNITQRKLKIKCTKNEFSDEQLEVLTRLQEEVNNYKNKFNLFTNKFIAEDKFLDNLLIEIFKFLISVFRKSQLLTFKENNIMDINITTNSDCPICKLSTKFIHSIEDLISNCDSHPFCNLEYRYISDINEVKLAVLNRIKIICPNLITDKIFMLEKDILNNIEFKNFIKNTYDNEKINNILYELKNNPIKSIELNNIVYISDFIDIEYFIIKYLIKDKINLIDNTWFKENFYKKQETKIITKDEIVYKNPFVNYIASLNYENYILESFIFYLLNDNLKDIDIQTYNKISEMLEKGEI